MCSKPSKQADTKRIHEKLGIKIYGSKKKILYIHGFNSAKSDKMNFLSTDDITVTSLSLSWEPRKAIHQLETYISNCKEKVHLVGMSLGGFYAVYLTEKFNLKNTILVNPSVDANNNLRRAVGTNTNYKTGEKYVFTEQHLTDLSVYKVDNRKNDNYLCFIGENDDVISPEDNQKYFKNHIILKDTGHRVASLEEYKI